MPQLPQLGKERVTRLQSAVLDWFAVNQRDMPWRRTRDPYLVLLSEVMLQQTQVARVLPKYLEFVERFPTVRHLAGAPLAEVIRAWSPLGYNLRAVRLHRAAQLIVERHGGVVPREPAELRAIPGLGEYSAAAVACFAYEEPVGVVDTNVRRVLTRVFPDAA
ncbi:MAG: A/G-specific adenine glycosylase, partial [SAR202 cluster bacterium]|nr:A/G-specific adenine glycosylase [SAR202 cluster bacterium]